MTSANEAASHPMKAISADALPSMFQAVAGLRNLRAAAAMLSCFTLSVVVAGLIWMLFGRGLGAASLGVLAAAFLIASGIHAGGLLLMDQAKQAPLRSLTEAIVQGMWCVPRSIVLVLGLTLAVVAVYLLMALLFFVCKMPGLGPLLYAVVFPVSVVLAGLTFTGLFMGMMIALAAMWDGATVASAFGKAFVVLRTRLIETVLLSFVVLLLAGFVFSFVGGVLMTGFLPAVGMSATMLGAAPQMFSSMGAAMMGMGGGGLGGYALAGSFGGGLLFALTMTLVFQVWLLGINLVFLKVTQGLDASQTEAALQSGLAQVRRKAAEMGSMARQAAENTRAQAAQAMEKAKTASPAAKAVAVAPALASAPVPTDAPASPADKGQSPPSAHTCPACAADIAAEDAFCGACGQRLHA